MTLKDETRVRLLLSGGGPCVAGRNYGRSWGTDFRGGTIDGLLMKTGLRQRRSSKGSSSGVPRENNLRLNRKDDAVTSLKASLRSLKSKLPIADDALWNNSIETVTKELLQKRKTAKKCSALCRKGFKGLTVVMCLLLLIGVFLYLYKPASFFLKRKLHSRYGPRVLKEQFNIILMQALPHISFGPEKPLGASSIPTSPWDQPVQFLYLEEPFYLQ